jgi:integrase
MWAREQANPIADLKRSKVRSKKLKLPSRQEFPKFVQVIESGGSRDSKNAADLVRFLAYSGMRVGESKHVTWHDIDFEKKKLHVRGDPETGIKNSEVRVVPMIPELESMLKQMRHERADEPANTPIMQVRECQKSMDRAAKIVGMERITHHDLRHLVATICIESGVDIPTVSCWLGIGMEGRSP